MAGVVHQHNRKARRGARIVAQDVQRGQILADGGTIRSNRNARQMAEPDAVDGAVRDNENALTGMRGG